MNHLVVKTKVNQYDSKAKVGIFGMSAIFSVSSGSLQETVNYHCSAQQYMAIIWSFVVCLDFF